ncbi:MAG: hypothetical protein ACLQU1_18635 [Bryobacteraceae bacterium]
MQEYFAAATGKLGVDPETAQQKVQLLTRARVVRFVEGDVIAAIELHRLNRISFWDAMIFTRRVCRARTFSTVKTFSKAQHWAAFASIIPFGGLNTQETWLPSLDVFLAPIPALGFQLPLRCGTTP